MAIPAMMATIKYQLCTKKSLTAMTASVMPGSFPPTSSNWEVKVGTILIIMMATTTIITRIRMTG